AGGTVTITVVATISPTATGVISNQGQSIFDTDGDNSNDDSHLTDDPSTAAVDDPTSFAVKQANDVTATKSVSGTFVQGTNVTYTIVLTNNMTVAQPNNFQHEFTDILPADLTYVSSSATSGTTGFCCGNTFFWDGSIPAGGTVTITIVATISPTATGVISNQGQSIFDTDGDNSNDDSHLTDDPSTAAVDDPTSFTVVSPNAYTATKSVSGTFVAGTNVTYTITLTNGFAFTLDDNAGDELTDILPASLTLVSANATSGTALANVGTNTVTWNGSIAASSSVTITIVATINANATGNVDNQATVAYDADDNGSNESAGATNTSSFTVVPANSYTATKSVSGTFVAGTNVTYTITLTNGFAFTLDDNVGDELTDVLPASLTLVSANATSGTAAANVGTNTVTWNGSIAPSSSVTITIVATINANATGTVDNQATVAYDADDNGSNEAAGATNTSSFTVVPANAYTATKSASGTFVAGTNVTYTITLTNGFAFALDDNAGDELTDVLPSSLTLVSANATSGTALANTGTNTVTWNGSIAPSSSVTITTVATINANATGTVDNQATVAYDADDNGSNEAAGATNTSSFTVVANSYTATKSASGTFVAGTNVTYTITLTNDFAFTLDDNAGDELTDILPASLTLVSANATSGTAAANVGTNTVTWNGSIAPSSSVTITIVATINANATGTVDNQATVAYDADDNGSNESAGATNVSSFTVVPANSYSATKTVTGLFYPGGAVTYTVVLTNGFAHTLADNPGDEFVDVIPSQILLTSASATSGTALANTGTNTVTWNGSLAPSASVTITINGTIDPTAPSGTISNQGTAFVDVDNNGTNETSVPTDDPNAGGPQGTSFALHAASDVSATKSVATGGVVGGSVTYTITITNNLPHTLDDNPGDELIDVLPPELALVSANASSGTAVANSGTNTVTWNGSIASGGSVTITITATILSAGTISNQGQVFIDLNDDNINETTIQTQAPGGGPTTFVAAAAAVAAIPSLSPAMLLALALMLAAVAGWKMTQ
ncbi:MAG: beta strand repeat-containing protein, partial [Thermoanaerobaculia bacterium]